MRAVRASETDETGLAYRLKLGLLGPGSPQRRPPVSRGPPQVRCMARASSAARARGAQHRHQGGSDVGIDCGPVRAGRVIRVVDRCAPRVRPACLGSLCSAAGGGPVRGRICFLWLVMMSSEAGAACGPRARGFGSDRNWETDLFAAPRRLAR